MTPDLSRREVLRAATVATAPLLAGCTGSDDEGTPHPDEGTDSYGVRVRNESDLTMTLDLKIVVADTGEYPWEETATVEDRATRTWASVITGDREQVLVAEVIDHTPEVELGRSRKKANFWITPGEEDAPDVRFLDVVLEYRKEREHWDEGIWIHITHDETDIGEDVVSYSGPSR